MAKYRPIRAYHGSPYDFDRFDPSKIGTGEGAAAYGHGMYFAENENVARDYRRRLSGPAPVLVGGEDVRDMLDQTRDGPLYRTPFLPRTLALKALRQGAYGAASPTEAVDAATKILRDSRKTEEVARAMASLRQLQDRGIEIGKQPGHMYEVEIGYPQESLLDWDAPISAQSQNVIRALQKLNAVPELPSSVPWEPDGSHAYRRLKELHLANSGRAAIRAAKMLSDDGVHGIRYLDEVSRSAGEGTHNYVMFPGTEGRIRILRKFGLLAPIAAGAAAGQGDGTRTDATMQPILGGLTQ